MRKSFILFYIFLFILFLETVLNVLLFNKLPHILTFIFSFYNCLFIYTIISYCNLKVKKRLLYSILFIITFLFIIQLIYFKVYGSIISIYSITNGGQVFQFFDMILKTIIKNLFSIFILFIPFITFIILNKFKYFDYNLISFRLRLLLPLFLILTYILSLLSIEKNSNLYSPFNLYYKIHNPSANVNTYGFLTNLKLDLKRSILKFEEKHIISDNKINKPIDNEIEYNMFDIDFEELIKNESNENIKLIHNYFKDTNPTAKNEYTGIFKDKNLIVILAESLSNIAINKDITPTLYKLYNEGFKFNNFYTPLFPVSTADGEYMSATSLIPKEGVWSMKAIAGNYIPYSYPNVFEKMNYKSYAYHNHTGTYYSRDKFVKTLGYDTYKACKMGLNINCSIWPESDLEMINATINDYINDDKFLAYYVTVSGHLNYKITGNMMVYKNFSKVKHLNLSDLAKGYLAANIELDLAIESLLKTLEEKNKLDDTVIVISGDHYPYGLELSHINELSNYTRDDNFTKHHMPLIIYNSALPKKGIEVNNLASSIDILPTVLNLFGVDYDSRLLIGKDIFSNDNPLVTFSNRSFITKYGRYNSITKKFEKELEFEEDYINKMNTKVYNQFLISSLILENNYYTYLESYIE